MSQPFVDLAPEVVILSELGGTVDCLVKCIPELERRIYAPLEIRVQEPVLTFPLKMFPITL